MKQKLFVIAVTVFFATIGRIFTYSNDGTNGCMGVLDSPCRCDRFIINCTNAGFKTTEIFLQITDLHFPELDTLILTGNHFHELETHLFGPATYHKRLSKLFLSNNSIKFIQAGAFQELTRLEELSLNDNQISLNDLHRLRLFDRLKTLKILQLEKAFDTKNLDAKTIEQALHIIFGPKSELDELQYLHLQRNNIQSLNGSTFCNLPSLEFLYLQNNNISSFTIADTSCIVNLLELHLENNKIARYTKQSYDKLNNAEHLKEIHFESNPIDCTCEQNDFVKWLKSDDRVLYKNETYCFTASPEKYKNRPVVEIEDDSLKCESDGSGYMHGVYIICGIAIVGLAALLFCLFYANRGILCARRKSGLLLTSGGYEVLSKEPEVKAEMV